MSAIAEGSKSIAKTLKSRVDSVHIVAPARLHLGFLDLNGGLGRQFGSIGLALDTPVTELTLRRANYDAAEGVEQHRSARALKHFKAALNIDGNYHLDVARAIPAHAGLGSGTQLALAIGVALKTLEQQHITAVELAEVIGRGARSAIGMAAFESGGFVVDGGRGRSSTPPPVVFRGDFPADWRIMLVKDPERAGVHGDTETEAFANLDGMTPEESGALCRLMMMQLLPALIEQDIANFGSALSKIQEVVGRQFAVAQGGIWASPAVESIVKKMADLGAVGIGQSSWGPTGFAFVPSQAVADSLYQSLIDDAKRLDLEIDIVRGRNHGASIQF
ncbi:Beta-ribofuranosylaminobenzene 5'-phosphate synthase [Candidatus Filomicrobium marinum]|uniref:Beta-ribofuranosylaminobenzene 5'-phosphate synthase n=1 Tax=Candidatus Filomicrobium marinum TaxID=1608628 RepID=A0A0D6JBR2_9HYPH|nr:beta-ribofuranosylaminobenzene 5'-phosphate synthase family protein [Candidatus Filomicrobium marinum]CFX04126.1 Beta-ribofuranosylaminobenzene 5'-phosphate synthase [Candidatus Filomicrobium marinum]CPR15980.1 Beta-ribofuranosylaminobenzene 5'-phosphate synthase [Candidatus Filomicrobium marinum]